MTTTKPPVLTDETTAILEWIVKQADDAKEQCGPDPEPAAAIRNSKLASIANAAAQALGMARGPSYIKQAVLARAGADAVRDAAQINHHTGGRYISYIEHPADCEVSYPEDEQFTARVRPALKGTPAAAVADAQPVAWAFDRPGEPYRYFTTDPKRDNFNPDKLIPLYTAPQAGQLSGNVGEVEPRPLMVTRTSENSVMLGFRSCREASVYERAAIAASKGANHG